MTLGVRYGSGGWRGRLGDTLTAPALRAIGWGIACELRQRSERRPLLLAHDGRFLGASLADLLALVLSGAGCRVMRVESPIATPIVTHTLARGGFGGALVLTASHNEAADHGLKVFDGEGCGIGREQARAIERFASSERGVRPDRGDRRTSHSETLFLVEDYARTLAELLEQSTARAGARAIAGARSRPPVVIYDALHGCGAPALLALLAHRHHKVVRLRAEPDPRFGGARPDPEPEGLATLCRRVAETRGAIGVATDGDGDRVAAIDESGARIPEPECTALLVDFLVREFGVRGGVALSAAAGRAAIEVAEFHRLPVTTHPVGFRHIAGELHRGSAEFGGDESGGFAWRASGCDKDGILAAALMVELAQRSGGLRAARKRLARLVPIPRWAKRAWPADPHSAGRLRALAKSPPGTVAGTRVIERSTRHGLRFGFADGFLMLRVSETEGVVRCYAEAPNGAILRRRVLAAAALLETGPGPSRRSHTSVDARRRSR